MLLMTETCPNCGAELNVDNAAGGLCGRCLFERGIEFTSTACFADGSTPGTPPFAAPDPIEVEADLLNFDVLELVGQGGMGAVYKARQRNLDRTVAIKILPRQSGGQEFADRFQREARALARPRHDNIVMAYDADEVEDFLFLVMELVEGMDLHRLVLKHGALPLRLGCELLLQAGKALHYAHEQGLVHRDIKPANLLIPADAVQCLAANSAEQRQQAPPVLVKVVDFGLARLHGSLPGASAGPTQQGFLGTPEFVAPEQARNGRDADKPLLFA